MSKKRRSRIILKILNKTYPKVPIPLKYKNTFTLLVSVLLSAQCTDVNVNNVTKNIYPKYNKPEHFVKLGRRKIERLIKRIGIFRIKAKSIFYLSKTLVEKYKSKVPKTYEELILLLASSWYLWKLTSNFLDEPTKKELTNSFNNLKNKFSEGKQNFSKAKISEAWEKYKEEGGALSNKDKS